jgi:type IV pilus assembly protein PilE
MKNKGFTLIELVVAIAIVGILATIAWPSYRTYVLKSQRVDMQTKLMSFIELQERYFITNFEYASSMTKLGFPVPEGSAVTFDYQGAEAYEVKINQCIGAAYPDTPGFSLCYIFDAQGKGAQANDGDLLLDNRGRKEHNLAGVLLRDWSGNDL